MVVFILNDKMINTDRPTGFLLLDLIRYEKTLTGTKIGCREGDCGACTVLIGEMVDGQMNYEQVTSCLTPIGNIHGKHVVTIEGLNMEELSPVQQFMIDETGTQCGFCTVGFVVSLTAFCLAKTKAAYSDAIIAIDGNICRCTGYRSIERAVQHVTDTLAEKDTEATVDWLVERKFIPSYFTSIPEMISELNADKKAEPVGISVGGGTDLYVQQPDDLVELNIDPISNSDHLRFISFENGICTLGGGSTVTDLNNSKELHTHFPRLWEHIKLVSSSPIRNISTVAGNFVNASPIGDLTAFFLALNAQITLSENGEERTIDLKDFYKGYKNLDRTGNEIISKISFEVPRENIHFNFEKVSKRIHLDIASVNTAAQIEVADGHIKDCHFSAGGVGPIPTYLHKTVAFLNGKMLNAENIKSANEIMQSEISPISDVRGTENYKRLLLRQLFYAHFIKLFSDRIKLEQLV